MPGDEDAFVDGDGNAILRPCALLFIDILGVREMASGPDAGKYLAELSVRLNRPLGDFLGPTSPWPAAFFSDTLVMLDPISAKVDPNFALVGLAIQASWVQVNLAAAGYFVRGALTIGEAHLKDGLLFGPALVEAYDLERRTAVNPRVILSEVAVEALTQGMIDGGQEVGDYFRVEQDGSVFIDYLDILLDDPEDPVSALTAHRDAIRDQLAATRSESRKWDKYRWAADYHDSYCRAELPGFPELLVGDENRERRIERFKVTAD